MSSYLGCRKPHLGCRTTSAGVQRNLVGGGAEKLRLGCAEKPNLGCRRISCGVPKHIASGGQTMSIASSNFYYTNSSNIVLVVYY